MAHVVLLLVPSQVHALAVAERLLVDGSTWPTDPLVIHTDDGPIQGKAGWGVTTYHGVPFAAPPVGSLRFKYAKRPTPWTATLQTVRRAPPCPQLDLVRGLHIGEEDCLCLSVYVPSQCTISDPCPVMQFIHGGAWIVGSNFEFGMYNATKLAVTHGVIVVAGNYRLDSLGWLALEELEKESGSSYGNYGLHDQRLAMQWTQRNIASFGGLPNEVTLFGESAGGFSVCQHIASPASDRLFSRAIIESGDCDGPWAIADGVDAKAWGDVYATAAGCPAAATPGARLLCLRSLPLRQIQMPYLSWLCTWKSPKNPWCTSSVDQAEHLPNQATLPLHAWPSPRPPLAPLAGFNAVVDGTASGLPSTPLALIKQGRINRSPSGDAIKVMLGTATDEFALFMSLLPLVVHGAHLPVSDDTIDKVVRHLVAYHDSWNATTVAQIEAAYPSGRYRTPASRLTTLGTDVVFRCGTRAAARALTAQGIPTYLYQFDYKHLGYLGTRAGAPTKD